MPKIAWVALPLGAYALYRGVSAWRHGAPSRHALNVQTSVLLMFYLLITAGLGIFWVANQQLPVFDLHYLFGYATLLLVGVHLAFNLPVVARYLRKTKRKRQTRRVASATLWRAGLGFSAVAVSFVLGMRHGESALRIAWDEGSAQAGSSGSVDAIVKYHEYSSSSRTGVFARAAGVDWGPRPPPFKRYDGHASVALTPSEDAAVAGRPLGEALRSIAPNHARLDRDMLGAILFSGAGVTQRKGGLALRASPSSGALFSSELYVLVWDVAGLTPGVYHYDAEHHRLDVVAEHAPPVDRSMPSAHAAIVVTSIFRRTGFKYRDRAYRYAAADTGHLIENVRIGAAEVGLDARPVLAIDEQAMAERIGVDGREEGVLAVLALERAIHAERGMPPALSTPPPPSETAIGVTGMVHVATSLRGEPLPDTAVRLPSAQAHEETALGLIRRRRSQRRFENGDITLEQLGTMLDDAARAPRYSDAVRVDLVVNRVTGLRAGVYRYHPHAHAVVPTRLGDAGAEAGSAALAQDVIYGAAVVVILSAHRPTMFAHGARGYRHAFLEAGMFSERYLLSALAQGLGACPVGAFYDDDAAALIGVETSQTWVIHFIGSGPT